MTLDMPTKLQNYRYTTAVFVGDRGMAAQARVREDLEPNGCDWIFALRAAGVAALAENGALQPTLFDERDMAEIECQELFPGERLVVCRNPLPAEERTRKRKDLIAAAAQDLIEIRRAVRRDKRPLRNADAIRRRAERALRKRKMRKHFDPKIGTGSFSWKHKKRNIADEAALDGFYVIRTNVQEERMSAAVETCKRLGRVERAFRTMKTSDLQVRPIRLDRPGPRPSPDLHARLLCRKAPARRARPGPRLARRQGRALVAGQAEGGLETHEFRRGRPRLPGTARAARNVRDEPDRALGAGKAGIRRPRLADADPETGAAVAERGDSHAAAPFRSSVSSGRTAGIQ